MRHHPPQLYGHGAIARCPYECMRGRHFPSPACFLVAVSIKSCLWCASCVFVFAIFARHGVRRGMSSVRRSHNFCTMEPNRVSAAAFADTKQHHAPSSTDCAAWAAITVVKLPPSSRPLPRATSTRHQPRLSGCDFFLHPLGLCRGYAYDDRWQRMTVGEFLKRRFIRPHPLVVLGAGIGAALFTQGCLARGTYRRSRSGCRSHGDECADDSLAPTSIEVRGVGEMYPLPPSWLPFRVCWQHPLVPSCCACFPTRR